MTAVRIDHPKFDRVSRRWGQIAQAHPRERDAEQLGLQRLGPPGPTEIWGCPPGPGVLLGQKALGERAAVESARETWSLQEILEQPVTQVQPVTMEVDEERGPPHCPMR